MKKFLQAATAAIVVASVPGAAMAASELNVTTWSNIPYIAFYADSGTIDYEYNYTRSATPDSVSIGSFDASGYSYGLDGTTAAEFTGYLNVAVSGTYTFNLAADDAARLSIDGTRLLDSFFYTDTSTASIFLEAGAHTYDAFTFQTVGGQGYGASILGDSPVSFSAEAPAVPEPATWAMFIGGFGLIGGTMRRKRTTVRFA